MSIPSPHTETMASVHERLIALQGWEAVSSSWGEGEGVVSVCRKPPVAGCSHASPPSCPEPPAGWPGTQRQGVITDLRPGGFRTEAMGPGNGLLFAQELCLWRKREDEEAETCAQDKKEQLAGVPFRSGVGRERRGRG